MPHPVVHFEIVGKDPTKLQGFYRDLFDWHVQVVEPIGYGIVDTHSDGIGGGIGGADNPAHPGVTFYVEVDDTDAYLRKLESMGGKTVTPTTVVPGMVTFALFADPEGNVVGLVNTEVPPA